MGSSQTSNSKSSHTVKRRTCLDLQGKDYVAADVKRQITTAKSASCSQNANEAGRKAAEDSRTPKRCRDRLRATSSARFWSAAVLCRFGGVILVLYTAT